MNVYITRKRFERPALLSASQLRILQYARAQAMQDALRKAEAAHPRENAPKAGQIRSLGLIGKEKDSKAILGAATKLIAD